MKRKHPSVGEKKRSNFNLELLKCALSKASQIVIPPKELVDSTSLRISATISFVTLGVVAETNTKKTKNFEIVGLFDETGTGANQIDLFQRDFYLFFKDCTIQLFQEEFY